MRVLIFILVGSLFCSCGNNLLLYKHSSAHSEMDLYYISEETMVSHTVFCNVNRDLDESYSHKILYAFKDSLAELDGKTFEAGASSEFITRYTFSSEQFMAKEDGRLSGTVKVISANRDRIILKENIKVVDLGETYRFKG